MTRTRICITSGPRNVSTATMYAFAQRADTVVLDEPIYAHYLAVSGVWHPGREEVLAALPQDLEAVKRELLFKNYPEPVLMIKNMAHHMLDVPPDLLDEFHNVFLIRDPREVITSFIKQVPQPTLLDLGYEMQANLFRGLQAQGKPPMVIDGKDLRNHPESILRQVCANAGIPFDPAMLSWPAGPNPADGVWAKYWYHALHKSTGFVPHQAKNEAVPERLHELWQECAEHFEMLHSFAIKP